MDNTQSNVQKTASKSGKPGTGVEQKNQKSIKLLRLWKTLLLVLSFVGMGMASSVLNACIPDLRVRLDTTVEGLSYAFAFGACGALVSTPLAAVADRFGSYSELILGGCLVLSAVSNALRPVTVNLWMFAVCDFFDDIAWGLLSNVANSLVLLMWGASGNSPIHAMHFGFPVGAALGGQIARAFVSTNSTDNNTSSDTWLQEWLNPMQSNIQPSGQNSWSSYLPFTSHSEENEEGPDVEHGGFREFPDDSRIEVGFFIIAGFNLALGIVFTLFQFTGEKRVKDQVNKKSYKWKEIVQPSKWGGDTAKFGVLIFLFFTFFQIALQGCDKGIKQYLTTYAVDSDLGFDNQEAASLSSVYYLLDAVGMICSIILARYVSIKILLFVEVHCITLLSVLLIIFGTQDRTALYVLVPMFAMFKGPTWASSYAWPNYYIIMLSTLLGVAKLSRNIADIFMNALQGYLYTNTVIESIFYTTLAYALVMCLLVYVTYLATWNRPGRHDTGDKVKDKNCEKGYMNTVVSDISLQDHQSEQHIDSTNQDTVVTYL